MHPSALYYRTMYIGRPYQNQSIDDLIRKFAAGKKKIVYQSPTGSGKTVSFTLLVSRFLSKNSEKCVLITVHRKELLRQAYDSMERNGLDAGVIVASKVNICKFEGDFLIPNPNARVIIAMVETVNNRLKKIDKYLHNIGMLICDEAHIASFNKIYEHFPTAYIVGVTATPVSSNKKMPMKAFFDDIVCSVQIKELIQNKWLAKNASVTVKGGVNRKKLKIKNGEFDASLMGASFSSPKFVDKTVDAYKKYCLGEKCIVFNCNIAHSKLVNEAFIEAGYNSMHLDGETPEVERRNIFKWFKQTDDAILNNVDIATVGFDEPSIQAVIVNLSTLSLTKWLQMCGRGSRVFTEKSMFKIIDLGSNIATHMDWSYPHDWIDLFHNPDRARKGGIAPVKHCPKCNALIHLSTKICPYCQTNLERPPAYDTTELELIVFSKDIDIDKIISKNHGYNKFRALHFTKSELIRSFRKNYKYQILDEANRIKLNSVFLSLVRTWAEKANVNYDYWLINYATNSFMTELNRIFGPALNYSK